MISASKNLLCYFSMGFAMLLIIGTYFLMKKELRKEVPRNMALQTIWVFMVLTLTTTLITGMYAVSIANKNIELQVRNIKSEKKIEDLMIQISELTDMVKNTSARRRALVKTNPGGQTEPNFGYLEENGRLRHHYNVLRSKARRK